MAIAATARPDEKASIRLRIVHTTSYRYRQAVGFNPHRLILRPGLNSMR